MGMTAQDKILYVANKLGLATLKDMQGSTGAVYDTLPTSSGTLFSEVSKHTQPASTNLNDNKFEVNEALLIETIGFSAVNVRPFPFGSEQIPLWQAIGQDGVIVFDLIIGNKQVMKDTPIFAAGMPSTFSSAGLTTTTIVGAPAQVYVPRTQIFLEGAGILIPPQVEFQVNFRTYSVVTGAPKDLLIDTAEIQCYLFGTKVNLNFNTSL